jgi:hypothetical protein
MKRLLATSSSRKNVRKAISMIFYLCFLNILAEKKIVESPESLSNLSVHNRISYRFRYDKWGV